MPPLTESVGRHIPEVISFDLVLKFCVMDNRNRDNRSEPEYLSRNDRVDKKEKTGDDHSKLVLAVILIAVGVVWLLRQLGVHFHIDQMFQPFVWVFNHLGRILFSWPMVLVIIGLVMLAGKRSGGWILVVLGGIFLIPRIFDIPGFSFSLIFPLFLIVAGAALVLRKL